MKRFKYSTSTYIATISLVLVVILAGYIAITSVNETSYSKKSNEGIVDEEAAVLEPGEGESSDEDIHYIPNPNVELKETNYTIDEVYQAIMDQYDNPQGAISEELNDIYQNFYDYYDSSNKFKNMLGEEYDYDEYMFVKNASIVRSNKNMFGMYLITYSKCDVFSSLDNHSRDDKLSSYCVEYEENS